MAAAILLGGGASLAADSWSPWLAIGGGHESDLILTGTPDRDVVDGGAFADLSGGLSFSRQAAGNMEIAAGARSYLERFLNDDRRTLFGQSAWAEARRSGPGGLRLRLTGGGDYFDDSRRPQSRRLGGFVSAAAGFRADSWRLEAFGGLQGRRYPRLESPDALGRTGTYAEAGWSAGISGLLNPASAALVRVAAEVSGVDARDPWYDSGGASLAGNAWLRLRRGLWLTARAVLQQRDFDHRPEGEDSDSYILAGGGIESALSRELTLSLRYAFSTYSPPAGEDVDSHRFSAAITWRPGGSPGAGSTGGDYAEPPRAGSPHLFRVHAPGAHKVSVAGSFNGWDPGADPMAPVGGGWWEAAVLLPAGTHQYAYVVDGAARTPPEAETVVDDGFGGANGVIHILRKGL